MRLRVLSSRPAGSLCSIVPPFYQLKLLKELMRECAGGLAREGTVHQIVRPEPVVEVCRQITRRMIQNVGLVTDIWHCGGALPVLRDGIEN